MTGGLQDKSSKGGFAFPWPFPDHKPSTFYKLKSYATMCFVGMMSKLLFIGGLNKMVVRNKERLMEVLDDRSRPVITVANHRCNIDDPLLWTLQTASEFYNLLDRQRWTLAAHNICFSKQSHTTMFSLGRCVPCVRGEGIYQQGMDFCIRRLKEDHGWVHIFPEGKVLEDGVPVRFKWGVGRLLMECTEERAPILVPIWINGMNKVWPSQPPYYPRFGQTVEVHVGEPIDTAKWIQALSKEETESARKKATDLVQAALYSLGERVGALPAGTVEAIEAGDSSRSKYYPSP